MSGHSHTIPTANCTQKVVPIIPSRVWSQRNNEPQKSPSNAQPSLLGLSMRLCQPETASDNVWHVLDVLEGSPAESAGLVPMGDWILGRVSLLLLLPNYLTFI